MTGPNSQSEDDAATAERGTQFPADTLAEAITMLDKVRTAVGLGAAKREVIANALGYKSLSGHAARRLGTLSHYGLLERAGKGAARISQLGKAILMPTSDSEKTQAIGVAARTPNLYATLIAKHTGHALPTMLTNLLTREHGVSPTGAEAAAKTFRETMEFAGLLRNGVLVAESQSSPPEESGTKGGPVTTPTSSGAGDSQTLNDRTGIGEGGSSDAATFTISLDPRTGRMAKITMPVPVTSRDLRNVEAWVNYMKLTMHDDEAPDISSN